MNAPLRPGLEVLAAARAYLARGWQPVVLYGPTEGGEAAGKRPVDAGWQRRRYHDGRELEAALRAGRNVGLALGAASGGLTDVDLDCPEAVAIAPELLPPTPARHGRASARASHWWYVVRGSQDRRCAFAEEPRAAGEKGAMLAELRGGGGTQTVAPPSVHRTGERLAWEDWPADADAPPVPAVVSWDELYRAVALLALAAALVRGGWTREAAVAFARSPAPDWTTVPAPVLAAARKWKLAPQAPAAVVTRAAGVAHGRAPTTERSPFTEAVLAACGVDRALTLLGLEPTDGGRRRITCPLHEQREGGSRNTFTAAGADGTVWKCHSTRCARGGDAITLVELVRGLGRLEARQWLADQCGVEDPRDTTPPAPVARPRRPVVTADEARAWTRAAIDTPGRASLDRRGTGVGKSHGLAEVLVDVFSDGARAPGVVVAAASHDAAREFAELAERVARQRGKVLPLAVVPRLARGDDDDEGAIPCAAGREDEYHEAASRGWNPRQAVCRDCPHLPVGKGKAKDPALEPCAYVEESERAWSSAVVVAQKAHVSLPGFWTGRGAKFTRLVVEEDASDALVRGEQVTPKDLDDFGHVVTLAEEWARRDAARARPADRAALEARAVPFAAAHRLLADVRRLLEATAPEAGGALPVALAVDATAAAAVLRAVAGEDDTEGTLQRAAEVARRRSRVKARNLLPLLVGLAQGVAEGAPLVGLVLAEAQTGARVLRVDVRRRPPADRAVLVLDATGDREVLEADLARPVEVLEGGTDRRARVVQLADRLWSRAWFGLRRPQSDDDPGHDTARVEEVAGVLARLVERVRALRVGLVTYQALEEPLARALRAALPERPRWGADPRRPRVAVETMHFGACRGSNAFREAGCDVVLVVGTPEVPPVEVMRRRLRLGAATAEELAEARGWVEGDSGREFTWAAAGMRRAHASLVAAELAQAIGRGARGDWAPPSGTWVLSSAGVVDQVPDEVVRTTTRGACLDVDAARHWSAAVGLGSGGWRVVRDAAGVPARVARRLAGAVAAGLYPLDHGGCDTESQGADGALVRVSHPGTVLLDVSLGQAYRGVTPTPRTSLATLAETPGRTRGEVARWLGVTRTALLNWLAGIRQAPPEVEARARELLDARPWDLDARRGGDEGQGEAQADDEAQAASGPNTAQWCDEGQGDDQDDDHEGAHVSDDDEPTEAERDAEAAALHEAERERRHLDELEAEEDEMRREAEAEAWAQAQAASQARADAWLEARQEELDERDAIQAEGEMPPPAARDLGPLGRTYMPVRPPPIGYRLRARPAG